MEQTHASYVKHSERSTGKSLSPGGRQKQRERRDLFKEAVVYARWIIADPQRREAFKNTLPRRRKRHVFNQAIRRYVQAGGVLLVDAWFRKHPL